MASVEQSHQQHSCSQQAHRRSDTARIIYVGEQGVSTRRPAPDDGPPQPIFGQEKRGAGAINKSYSTSEPRLTFASQIWFVKVHVAVGECLTDGMCVSASAERVYDSASFVDFLHRIQAAVNHDSSGTKPLLVLGMGHWDKYGEHWPLICRFAEPFVQ